MNQNDRQITQMVAEIFSEVGIAFSRIGEFATMINPESDSPHTRKVTDAHVQIVAAAIAKFTEDIEKMCQRIKDRTTLLLVNKMKRQAYEEAGLIIGNQRLIATPETDVTRKRVRTNAAVTPQSSTRNVFLMPYAIKQEVGVKRVANTTVVVPQPSGKPTVFLLNSSNAVKQDVDDKRVGNSAAFTPQSSAESSGIRLNALNASKQEVCVERVYNAAAATPQSSAESSGIRLNALNASKQDVGVERFVYNTAAVMLPSSSKTAGVTLNMLNTKQEADVEGLSAADQLEYKCLNL